MADWSDFTQIILIDLIMGFVKLTKNIFTRLRRWLRPIVQLYKRHHTTNKIQSLYPTIHGMFGILQLRNN